MDTGTYCECGHLETLHHAELIGDDAVARGCSVERCPCIDFHPDSDDPTPTDRTIELDEVRDQYASEMDPCDYCGGTGYDDDAPDDGTEDFDTCPICGGNG